MFEQLRQCFFDKYPENQNIDTTGGYQPFQWRTDRTITG